MVKAIAFESLGWIPQAWISLIDDEDLYQTFVVMSKN